MTFRSALVLGLCSVSWLVGEPAAADHHAAPDPVLEGVLRGDWRPEEDRARDAFRHPAETLRFFGLAPGQTVVEVWPGGGWYTRILARYVARTGGTFYAAGFADEGDYRQRANAAFRETFLEHPETYGRIRTTVLSADSEGVAPDGSADLVLTFRNAHNWVSAGMAEKAFADFYRALKPGGVLGVVEHRLPASAEQDARASSGYLHEEQVVGLAKQAGFVLEARSEVNANPKDTADHPFGVWTLPPSLRSAGRGEPPNPDFDHGPFLAIGESDRFTLKFRKPAE